MYDNAAMDAYLAFRIEVDKYNNRSVNLKLNREERLVDTTDAYQLTRAGNAKPPTRPLLVQYSNSYIVLRLRTATLPTFTSTSHN